MERQLWRIEAGLADELGDLLAQSPDEAVGWLCYLLEAIDNRVNQDEMASILLNLKSNITTRIIEGRW